MSNTCYARSWQAFTCLQLLQSLHGNQSPQCCDERLSQSMPTGLSLLSAEAIKCELEKFAGDPSPLIKLLKKFKASREDWVLVAAYYRRNGLYEFALQVTLALQEGE